MISAAAREGLYGGECNETEDTYYLVAIKDLLGHY